MTVKDEGKIAVIKKHFLIEYEYIQHESKKT